MPLYDAMGRPINTSLLRREIAGPSITAVRPIQSQQHSIGLNPIRLAAILRSAEIGTAESYLDLAEEMEERDLHYLAVLGVRKRQVSQLTVTVEPADETAEAMRDAELVEEWLEGTEIEDEIFDMLDAVGKGYSVHEIIWDMSERQWMPMKLKYQLPRWFTYDRITGADLKLRDPGGPEGWVDLAPAKFIVHRHAAKSGIPIRGGIARAVAWGWMFKNYSLRDWVRFFEGWGMPMRIGKYDRSATEQEKEILLRAVRDIAGDAAAIIPDTMSFELLGSSRGQGSPVPNADMYHMLLQYIDSLISKVILGQTLTTEPGESGSYSLGQVHDAVRHDIERSDARQLAATLNRDLVLPLVALNHGPKTMYPKIVIGREEQSDPAMLAEAVAKLVPLGLEVSQMEMRGKLGLSEPEPGEDILEPAMLTAMEGMQEMGNDNGMGEDDNPDSGDDNLDEEMAEALRMPVYTAEQMIALARDTAIRAAAVAGADDDGIEKSVAEVLAGDGWRPIIEPMIEPILKEARAAVDRGDDLRDFRERLPALFDEMDDAMLIESLGRMGFSAVLSGLVGDNE